MKPVWYKPLDVNNLTKFKQRIDFENLSKKESIRILDFGCGNGRYMYLLRDLFPQAEIIGVDINASDIQNLIPDFPNSKLIHPDKMDIDFPENSFDLIHSSNVIEHIPNEIYKKYIIEIKKILKPGSRFVFGTPNYPFKRIYDMKKAFYHLLIKKDWGNFKYYLFDDPTHVNPLNYSKLQTDFEIFSQLKLFPTQIFFPSLIKNKKFSDKIVGIAIK